MAESLTTWQREVASKVAAAHPLTPAASPPINPGEKKMSEAKHTKGPWQAVQHYSDSVSVVDAGGFRHIDAEHIAILLGYGEKLGIDHWADSPQASREVSAEEQAANARLIAAAPDLLDACRKALYALKGREHDQFLRDAIAKATGGAA